MIADLQSLPQEVIAEELLWRKARSFKDDPLGFVRWALPWGEPGPLDPGFEGACVCCAVFAGVSSQLKKSLSLDRDLSLLELSVIFYESPL
jgi:hypothetical protein